MKDQRVWPDVDENGRIVFEPTHYPSDLSDAEWDLIAEMFPQGPNSRYHKRSLVNAVLYLVDNGCKWRALPHDYPPHQTVQSFYWRAKESGLWDKVLHLVVEKSRVKAGREVSPTYAIIDSQSVKTIYASRNCGYDGGKKRKVENDI